jgi:carbon-monoxide dehydrogenase large subunit
MDGPSALAPGSTIHAELGDNLAFEHAFTVGDPEAAFATAAVTVELDFIFERQTGLTLEPRGLIADYNPTDFTLTVHHAHQSPFQMQDVYSRQLGIPEHKIRVIAPDVGGGFGLKLNVYAEEVAVAALSRILGRPVRFCADRLESFLSDIHHRDHTVRGRIATDASGAITAMSMDDLGCMGAYGLPMRFSIAEGMMAVMGCGAPYVFPHYTGRTRSVYVNKSPVGMYRGVGVPLACVVTEVLVDQAAAKLGMDPVAFRRLNYHKDGAPCTSTTGYGMDSVSFQACLDKLVTGMEYDQLRAEQAALRAHGVLRGIGISTFIEPTAYGPPYYGPSGARISVQDGCTIRLEPSGKVRCVTSLTDQGQGTLTGIAQIVAGTLGVGIDDIAMVAGDTAVSPYGGGAWASRGMAIGGEAALKTALALHANILALAASITQNTPEALGLADGHVVNAVTGVPVISLEDVGRIGYFRQDTLPAGFDVQLSVTQSHVAGQQHYYMANGVQGCHLELDPETGFIKLLGHWAADDCGRVINPLQVDEQIRGGIVQGIGAALFEELSYAQDGALLNGTMADYLAPMAAEMPDITVWHVETPEASTQLGAKGVGEAGLIGAMGAVWTAVNDALRPLGVVALHQPFTPERILDAIAKAR